MQFINQALDWIVSMLLWPFSSLPPVWGLVAISVVMGVLLLLVYGKVSNQKAIKDAKRKIYANLLESVLFRRDIRTSLKAQARMFLQGGRYFALAVPPILILAIPCVLVLAQLNVRFGYQPLVPGKPAIVSLAIDQKKSVMAVTLGEDSAFEASPPVRVEGEGEVFWKISPKNAEKADLKISIDQQVLQAPLAVGVKPGPIYAEVHDSWWMQLLYPTPPEMAVPASLSSLKVAYQEHKYNFLGLHLHWLIVFLLVSIVAGLVGSKLFGVEI